MTKNKEVRIISADEVRSHSKRSSVWMVIRNEVYDVTKFLEEHPGGEDPLLEASGQDATLAFDDVGHSKDAIEMMEKYHVGSLGPGTKGPLPKMRPQIWRPRAIPKTSGNEPIVSRRRIQTINVPHEDRRGASSCRPPPPEPPPRRSPLRWALAALAVGIIIGLAYRRYA